MTKSFVAVLASTVALTALSISSAGAQSTDKWLIAEVAPLTGPASTVGTRLNNVAKMWAEDVNARGGIAGKQVELSTCNDEGKPEKAVACVRDALRKGAVMFLGHSLTASTNAMQSALANGPVMIVASPNIVPAPSTFTFQTSPSDHHITAALADFVKANKLDKIGMIAATDASGEVGVKSAQEEFAKRDIELVLRRIDLKANDASVQLASVASDDIKLVYSSYSGGGAATVVKSFTNLGKTQPLVVSYANLSEAFIDVVKGVMPDRLLGTAITSLVPEKMEDKELAKRSSDFMAAYQAKYGEPADMINLLGKMDVDVVEAVLANVADPSNVQAVKTFLESTPIESVQHLKFSPESHVGLTEKDVIIVEYKDGAWKPADPVGK
jgi:branched-chain amino acid transport system substrate-binding protein